MASDPRDKRKTRERARSQVARARDTLRRYDSLAAAPARLRDAVRGYVADLAQEEVSGRLVTMRVTELKKVAKGLRLAKLEQAGISTVADVLANTREQLLEIPGIGAQTVDEIKAAAERLAAQSVVDTRPRFDPARRDPRHSRILAHLRAERDAAAAVDDLREAVHRFRSRAEPYFAAADRAGSRLAMLFSRRKRKDEALAGLEALEAANADGETRVLERDLAAAIDRARPERWTSDELWRDYEQQAASVNTALARITGSDEEDAERAEDFVDADLRQEIETLPFDGSLLRTDLRFYQLFGAKYAIYQRKAIIGDEMGLGKTIQALAVAAHLAANGERRCLVICPASVVPNWLNEIRKHTRLEAFGLHGPGREDEARRWLRSGGVAVTTFNTIDRLESLPRRAKLALVVVDEAHYIKNPNAKRSKAVGGVIGRSRRALLLSGTPMENRVQEFKALVGHLRPDLAQRVGEGDAVVGAAAFRQTVAPVYLRRNQEDVLTELPEKIEVEEWVQFNAGDEDEYREQVRRKNLMGMRRASSAMPGSAKLERLAELVEDAGAEGQKVIVFSYFLDVLKAVGERLGDSALGPITGKVAAAKRQGMIDEFARREGPAVILAQIEAGGVGLNIQAASVVVLAEPQWKPSIEQQAVARAHRMGQTRRVQVHRLLVKDGVDERIREVQEHKELLFEHYARQSDAKSTGLMATATAVATLGDDSIPLEQRIIAAERARLGLGRP
ncbi:Helix-hairpin-helix domain-containing protein [Glycomyces harbinensis]|uniref:Helix-hairpin-helix domain-containing protein n=2 Tax=Glycomyces harbinensis TaxID=58114 RepID=A0A1G6Y0G3_9ACTN|nr:Helix-hairpin-helix domain-containing protein [Glycomyces harbinensis]